MRSRVWHGFSTPAMGNRIAYYQMQGGRLQRLLLNPSLSLGC